MTRGEAARRLANALRALFDRAAAARTTLGERTTQTAAGTEAGRRAGKAPISQKRVSDWLRDRNSPSEFEPFFSLVTVLSEWAGESPNRALWRSMFEDAQTARIKPAVHVKLAGETDHDGRAQRDAILVGTIPNLAEAYLVRRFTPHTISNELAMGARGSSTFILHGTAGAGKSQIAAAYAWESIGAGLTLWIAGNSRSNIVQGYADAADRLGYSGPNPEIRANWFLNWLQKPDREWLIVIDDLRLLSDLSRLWPSGNRGRCVITTRRNESALSARDRVTIRVDPFSQEEAEQYILSRIPEAGSGSHSSSSVLAKELGGLPAGLAQFCSYVINTESSLSTHLRNFRDRRGSRLAELFAPADDYPTVATIWSLSIKAADELVPVGSAGRLLRIIALLDCNDLPIALLRSATCLSYIFPTTGAGDLSEPISHLIRFSLMDRAVRYGVDTLQVHALVQRAALDFETEATLSNLVGIVAQGIHESWLACDLGTRMDTLLRMNAQAVHRFYGKELYQTGWTRLLWRLGSSLEHAGLVRDAVEHWDKIVHEAGNNLGVTDRLTMSARHRLARARGHNNEVVEAQRELITLVQDSEIEFGESHEITLAARHAAAWWTGENHQPALAVDQLTEVLDSHRRVFGETDIRTLVSWYSLSRWLGQAGGSARAREELQKLSQIPQKSLAHDHPLTLAIRHELAWWIGEDGNPAWAVAGYRALLKDRVKINGERHPHVLATRHDLAWWTYLAGEASRALDLMDPLCQDFTEILGTHHPHTIATVEDTRLIRSSSSTEELATGGGRARIGRGRYPGDLPGLDFLQPADLQDEELFNLPYSR